MPNSAGAHNHLRMNDEGNPSGGLALCQPASMPHRAVSVTRAMSVAKRGKICVIVPFYQIEKGILARAVNSIAAQTIARRVDLIIVDDGSPARAEDEVDWRSLPVNACTIIRQSNEGAGAARNRGLAAVPPSTEFIAFLDSDDEWTECHLARGVQACQAGVDVYFSKVRVSSEPAEVDAARWPAARSYVGPIPRVDSAFFINSDIRTYTLQYGLPIQSVLFRRSIAPDLRFPSNVRRAGEDLQFALALVSRTQAIAFSERAEVLLGTGVNVYRGTIEHGATHAIARILDEIVTRRAIRAVSFTPAEAGLNDALLKSTVSALALQLLHAVRKGRMNPVLKAFAALMRWPDIWPHLLVATLRHARHKFLSAS
jgi:succinoglycan biosynthesis protein ExoW